MILCANNVEWMLQRFLKWDSLFTQYLCYADALMKFVRGHGSCWIKPFVKYSVLHLTEIIKRKWERTSQKSGNNWQERLLSNDCSFWKRHGTSRSSGIIKSNFRFNAKKKGLFVAPITKSEFKSLLAEILICISKLNAVSLSISPWMKLITKMMKNKVAQFS